MLIKIRRLVEELNANNIRYCHWKSNRALAESLAGETDIDLLVHRKDACRFRAILSQLSFRPATTTDGESFPSVEHYYGLDERSGVLVHVHTYFQVVTGESLSKNYRFPIEEMLLLHTREIDSVRVPLESAELLTFTLRIMLKHTSIVELILLARYWNKVPKEITWLLETGSVDEAVELINCWLPKINTDLFGRCVSAIQSPAPLYRRIILGFQLRSQLSQYARYSPVHAWFCGLQKFLKLLIRRLRQSKKGMVPRNGGAIIAFVGSEATGKSTLLVEMNDWLAQHFAVEQIHVGKPKSTIITFIPNLFVPALRRLFPTKRSTYVEAETSFNSQTEESRKTYPLTFAVRSALLAYDRSSMLTRAFSRAANGSIVLCDRYPSLLNGAPDSPQLSHLLTSSNGYSVHRRLALIESRFYRNIPSPDLVIYLSAPLEVTLLRNANRGKKEPEDYVRRRHLRSSNLEFGKIPIYEINTEKPFDQTVLEVKEIVWNAL